jgi:hypothetical protein
MLDNNNQLKLFRLMIQILRADHRVAVGQNLVRALLSVLVLLWALQAEW